MLSEDQYKDLNNELVVPAYRQFCRANGLNFHFWDELPEKEFDLKTSRRELEFHKEAMDLFNRLKPEYHLFRDNVISFQFISWGGDTARETKRIEEFFQEHASLKAKVGEQENHITTLEVIIFILLLLVFIGFQKLLPAIPVWIELGGSVLLIWGLHVWFRRRPVRKKDRDIEMAQKQLAQLREKINQSSSTSNPIRQSANNGLEIK